MMDSTQGLTLQQLLQSSMLPMSSNGLVSNQLVRNGLGSSVVTPFDRFNSIGLSTGNLVKMNENSNNLNSNDLKVGNSLSAIAAAAAQSAMEKDQVESKMVKRRRQIAAASRKSRAKRKRELCELRECNTKLQEELDQLKKKVKLYEEQGVGSSNESDNGCQTDTQSEQGEPSHEKIENNKCKQELEPLLGYVNSRIEWFFNQVKTDALVLHGEKLSEDAKSYLDNYKVKITLK